MKIYIHATSDVGLYRNISYGLEDSGQQRYYFQYRSGKFCYGDTEEEIQAKIDQWLDEHIIDDEYILNTFDVWYVNSIDNNDHIQVEAIDEQDARKIAKDRLGKECYHIINVYNLEENK